MNDVIIFEVQKFRNQLWLNGTAHSFNDRCGLVQVLGSERLATAPADRDLTGTFRLFGLKTAVAPGEWPPCPLNQIAHLLACGLYD